MPEQERLLATIEAVYAAGLDGKLWPQALAEVTRTVGGVAATLETFDRRAKTLIEFHWHGLPPRNEVAYLEHYSALNPRIPALINGTPGNIVTDYTVLDERSMERNPFYADLLAPAGYRYCVGGTLEITATEGSLFSVQRTRKQGHVGKQEIARMRLLLPHVRAAFDTMRRLRRAAAIDWSFEAALDWLSDGAALVSADGTVLATNQALRNIARQGDGVRIVKRRIDFAVAEFASRYALALGAVAKLRQGNLGGSHIMDFAVRHGDGTPPYIVSVRALPSPGRQRLDSPARAVVFIRDPLHRLESSISVLRDVFGFTSAEASLAQALQAGTPIAEYARQTALSLNTVYTHLRRIKEKTQTKRQTELLRRLNDLQLPVRDR